MGEQAGSNQLLNTVLTRASRSIDMDRAMRTAFSWASGVSMLPVGSPTPSVLPTLTVSPW